VAARVRHPHVVDVLDVGETEGRLFLVMELVEGPTLAALMRDTGPMPPRALLDLMLPVMAAVSHAHDCGVVHRDLKPANIIIGRDRFGDPLPKVTDFGVCKVADDFVASPATEDGALVGTIAYMAPEQVRAPSAVDARADQYALAVILYQGISGTLPFTGADPLAVLEAIGRGEVRAPRHLLPALPTGFEYALLRAISPAREARFASVRELARAILPFASNRAWSAHARDFEHADAACAPSQHTRDEVARERRSAAPMTVSPGSPGQGARSLTLDDEPEASPRRAPARTGSRRNLQLAVLALCVMTLAAAAVGYRIAVNVAGARAGTAAVASSPPRDCDVNAQCVSAHSGAAFVCRKADGRCLPLETDSCRVLAEPGDVLNDRTIWVGVMLPLTGEKAEYGKTFLNAAELARRDFARIAHGIPSQSGDGQSRPLAIVACDDAGGEAAAIARHLVDDVGVPAVLGFASTQEAIDLAQSLFIPKRTLTLVVVNQSALITAIPQPRGEARMIWRTALSSSLAGLPMSLFVPDVLEPSLRAAGIVRRDQNVRVALVRHNDAAGLSFADVLLANVRFNGKGPIENGANFRQFVMEGSPDPKSVISDLADFGPHVVLAIGSLELVQALFDPLERAWPRNWRFRPVYVLPADFDRELFRFVGRDAARRRRFFGLESSPATVANAKFTAHYNETFQTQVSLDLSPAPPYDAMYLLAYASYLAGDGLPRGTELAGAIAHLIPPGKPIDVGPAPIFEALASLRNGENIDLRGAGNPLDFDLSTGESPGDYVVECVGVDAQGEAIDAIASGIAYDFPTRRLRGTLHCP
jgi:ABC-type branched-subunit amino acid transport system substrate-binding protein